MKSVEDKISFAGVSDAFANAIEHLSISAQLEIARNLVFDRGGDSDSAGGDPALITAVRVLRTALDILDKNPSAAALTLSLD